MKKLAVLFGDVHLSHQPPACRDADQAGWYEIMATHLNQLGNIANGLPIICSGDVFDRWNSPPELINFAIGHLPEMYSVYGQHDTPNHDGGQIHRSAYWTLVRSGKIKHMGGGRSIQIGDRKLFARGFGWNEEIESNDHSSPNCRKHFLELLVAHKYCWTKGHSYKDAPVEGHWTNLLEKAKGYDTALFGDNHKGFLAPARDCVVFNNGTFMRRKSDEIGYRPHVGILMSDGSVEVEYLDTSKDRFVEREDVPVLDDFGIDSEELVQTLRELGDVALDFFAVVRDWLAKNKGAGKLVRSLVVEALEKAREEGK